MVADSSLVSDSSTVCVQRSASFTPVAGNNVSSSRQNSSTSSTTNDAPSRMAYLSSRFQSHGLSERATHYVLQSWRPGTEKQYSAAWKCFCSWCSRQQTNPLQASLGTVCEFLTDQFDVQKKSYSTVNTYRSALSSMLPPIDGKVLGEHPVVGRLLKGMFVSRPPRPKYATTWNVNTLLKHLETLHPIESLSQKQLTLKTVALAALVSAQRSQSLAALSLHSMVRTAEEYRFTITDILKTSRPGKFPLTVSLPMFRDNEKLCVYRCVTRYIQITNSFRDLIPTRNLFLSFGKPHKAVCASTISRWLKLALEEAGIDVTTFTGHSYRSASTSKAFNLGVSLDIILRTADWSNAGTFCKFYKKDIYQKDIYAETILTM